MAGIAVALSGGGHRAALFALGVLLYLVDAGKNASVSSIASVSGGSLTNGYVAQSCKYRTISAEQFEPHAGRFARQIVHKGTLWAAWETWLYLAVLVGGAAAALIGPWLLPLELWLRLIIFLAALLVVALLAQWRGAVAAHAFGKALYSPSGRATRLAEVDTQLDHVFCATDLHAGEHVYFSGRFVCSYRYGFGVTGDIGLHTVVHASAAYPGGFPARFLPTGRHDFQQPQDAQAAGARRLALVDGGVYDNMADQWGQDVRRRIARWPELAAELHEPEQLIVVNASAPMRWRSVWPLRLPLLGELLTFRRDVDVLYDNTTTPRRRLLHARFSEARRTGRGLQGAVVQISQSPFDLPTSFADPQQDDPAAQRARAVLALLAGQEAAWDELRDATSRVKTTLSRIPAEDGERLIKHGYVLAMANLHVLLDYPLLALPPQQRLSAYVSAP